eukprot:2192065-Amphidinium_carterae.1
MRLLEEFGMRCVHAVPSLLVRPGELCVRCKAEPEDLSHIVFRCPHWHKERRDVELPADDVSIPPCVRLHGQRSRVKSEEFPPTRSAHPMDQSAPDPS